MIRKMQKSILTLLSITILLLIWQLLAMLVRMPDLLPSVPRLLSILAALFVSGSFYQSIIATVLRGIIGISVALMAAIGISFLFYKCEWIYVLFRPPLAIMRSIPVISFILLALIFLNAESIPLIIAFLTMFPLLTENLTKGIPAERTFDNGSPIQDRTLEQTDTSDLPTIETIPIQRPCICFGLWLAHHHYGRGVSTMFSRNRRRNETGTSFYSHSRIDSMDSCHDLDQLSF